MNPMHDPDRDMNEADGACSEAHSDDAHAFDPDFELLESYLDGELAPVDIGHLERRLRAEPDLADALSRMSAEFAVRRAVWTSLEPTATEALAAANAAAAGARYADLWRRLGRLGRLAGAAAACLAVGFLAGWVGRGNSVAQAGTGPVDGLPLVRPAGPDGKAAPKADPKDEPFVYQVALTDEAGNITAVQKFDSLDEARNFAADVGRWQARQQELQQAQQARQGPPVVRSSGL